MLLGTFLYTSFDAPVLSLFLDINVVVNLPGYTAFIQPASIESAKQLPKVSS